MDRQTEQHRSCSGDVFSRRGPVLLAGEERPGRPSLVMEALQEPAHPVVPELGAGVGLGADTNQ